MSLSNMKLQGLEQAAENLSLVQSPCLVSYQDIPFAPSNYDIQTSVLNDQPLLQICNEQIAQWSVN